MLWVSLGAGGAHGGGGYPLPPPHPAALPPEPQAELASTLLVVAGVVLIIVIIITGVLFWKQKLGKVPCPGRKAGQELLLWGAPSSPMVGADVSSSLQ